MSATDETGYSGRKRSTIIMGQDSADGLNMIGNQIGKKIEYDDHGS
jgi:hypothetical protein